MAPLKLFTAYSCMPTASLSGDFLHKLHKCIVEGRSTNIDEDFMSNITIFKDLHESDVDIKYSNIRSCNNLILLQFNGPLIWK